MDGSGPVEITRSHDLPGMQRPPCEPSNRCRWDSGRFCRGELPPHSVGEFATSPDERSGELTKGEMIPILDFRVDKPELFVGCSRNSHSGLGEIARFVGGDFKPERRRIHNHEAVSPVSGVDRQSSEALDFQDGIQPGGEGGHIGDGNLLRLTIPASGDHFHQAARRLQDEACLRLGHGQDSMI